MPILDTPFILSLKKQYGEKKWESIFYAMKSKYPNNPAILQAEGRWRRGKLHRII